MLTYAPIEGCGSARMNHMNCGRGKKLKLKITLEESSYCPSVTAIAAPGDLGLKSHLKGYLQKLTC